MLKLQSVGSSLMAVGVLGLVGWIGYENYRVQRSRENLDVEEQMAAIDAHADPLPETHELLMVEMNLPDSPELASVPKSQLRIQFSQNEWVRLQERAKQCNLPVTRYIRDMLLESECPKRS